MITRHPEVARLDHRTLGRLGYVVPAFLWAGSVPGQLVQQRAEFVIGETGQPEVELDLQKIAQFQPQQFVVPLGILARAVAHDLERPRLRITEPRGDMHWHGLEAKLAGCLQSRMPGQNHHLFVHDYGLAPAEFGDRSWNAGHGLVVAPRVARIGTTSIGKS